LLKYPRGSEWQKWDLHVHTPESIVNNYLGSSPTEKWDRFLTDIEALPAEFKVLGGFRIDIVNSKTIRTS
jgi:hypothetical protein